MTNIKNITSEKNNTNKSNVLLKRDHEEWLELCKWLEINIFGYDGEAIKLKKTASLILDGFRKGQNVANNTLPVNGKYPCRVILMTFQLYKNQILNAVRGKDFKNEGTKMMYICKIAGNYINDVYLKYLTAQKTQEKAQFIDHSIMSHEGAEYQSTQTKEKYKNKKFEELW